MNLFTFHILGISGNQKRRKLKQMIFFCKELGWTWVCVNMLSRLAGFNESCWIPNKLLFKKEWFLGYFLACQMFLRSQDTKYLFLKILHQFLKKRDEFINPNIFATWWCKFIRKLRYKDYIQRWASFSCMDKIENKKFSIYFFKKIW